MSVLIAAPAINQDSHIIWHFKCTGETGPNFKARQPKKLEIRFSQMLQLAPLKMKLLACMSKQGLRWVATGTQIWRCQPK